MAAAVTRSAIAPPAVGRFELRRLLGQGAQATVWLGYDPRLDREVAVKLMRAGAGDDRASLVRWPDEARAVSRLKHANIVQVFEADVHEGQAYLVLEYVAGRTLAEVVREDGPTAPHAAVAMMADVLDALQTAHAAGVVHCDLKPSNIIVDAERRPRVMDFGIAARVQDPAGSVATGTVAGTPGYLSPQAAHGAPPAPAMDVFAAGLVLIELLSGAPVIAERDPYRAIFRVAHEDLALPASPPPAADDALRALLSRSIARVAGERIESAAAFRDALRLWAAPKGEGDGAAAGKGTLDFLLRRMRHKSDFPALSDAVSRIQRVANSEHESRASLSGEILKDVALTNKLLRLVNTANVSHAGGGSISTVSRAVALIGFAGIRNMALSLVLLEHMKDKAHAVQLREEFLRALMAGTLARELAPLARETEEAFMGAMFQNLGRLLTEYYFPEEARQVRGQLEASAPGTLSEGAASVAVLGLSYEDLGVGVARAWGLPDALQRCMRRTDSDPPARVPEVPTERLRWIAHAANTITDAMLLADPAAAGERIAEIAERMAPALGLAPRAVRAATDQARERLAPLAHAMGLAVAPASVARRLLAAPAAAKPADPDSLAPHALHATVAEDALPPQTARDDAAEVLAAGVAEITNPMVESFRLNEVLRMILETMFRALGFRRIVFCLRDAKTNMLTGRFCLGEGLPGLAQTFAIPLAGAADLFGTVCAKGVDVLISDATVPNIADRLPEWYRRSVDAPIFLLLPLAIKGSTLALIYADKSAPGAIELCKRELSLLRTLRNQAVMAFKQSA